MRRLPAVVLAALVAATVAAFFVTQHLKVTTPLVAGFPAPDPAIINPIAGGICGGVNHRFTRVSFYLLRRSDDVDVYVIDQSGNVVATLASGRHMRRGVRNPDGDFAWNGRGADGRVVPDGTYFFQVALIHQGRTVVISNAAGPEPITVQSAPPAPKVTSVSPALIPSRGRISTRIVFTGNDDRGGYVNLYRTDLPGSPRLVKTFGLPWGSHSAAWDGRIHQRAAPAGTYLVGLQTTDAACATGRFPARIPPQPGSTPNAGLTVRYLAAEPPLAPVPAGSQALVQVDASRASYTWSLSAPGAPKPAAAGAGAGPQLAVPVPPGRAGLYELTLRAGPRATTVPIVVSAPQPQRVLVVLPALTWQGLNPVDDTGDGIPNTLSGGLPITLARPLVDGLPAGFGDEAALVAYLDFTHRAYDLTTDLGLIEGTGPPLRGHTAVLLAGSERWLPASLAAALRGYVTSDGGRVLVLGVDSLRRSVTIAGGRARDPGAPARTGILGAAAGPLVTGNHEPFTVTSDGINLFPGAAGTLGTYSTFEPLSVPASMLRSAAGVDSSQTSIVAYRLGRGGVIAIAIDGFGSSLAGNAGARALVDRAWNVLTGPVPFGR